MLDRIIVELPHQSESYLFIPIGKSVCSIWTSSWTACAYGKKKQFQYAIQTSLRNKCTFLNELQFCIASNIYSSSQYHLANTEVFRVSVPKSTSTLLIDMFFCPCSKQSFMLCGKWNALIGCNLIWKLHCSWVAFKIWFRYCKRYQSRHVLDAGRPSPFLQINSFPFQKTISTVWFTSRLSDNFRCATTFQLILDCPTYDSDKSCCSPCHSDVKEYVGTDTVKVCCLFSTQERLIFLKHKNFFKCKIPYTFLFLKSSCCFKMPLPRRLYIYLSPLLRYLL